MTSSIPRRPAIAVVGVASVREGGYGREGAEAYWAEELVEEAGVTDVQVAAAEQLKVAVAAPGPWLPGEADHDGEPTWAGPRVQSRE
jgi:hypothetical protein